jgi:hypothetical protein
MPAALILEAFDKAILFAQAEKQHSVSPGRLMDTTRDGTEK